MDAWDFHNEFGLSDRTKVSEAAQDVLAILDLRQEVHSDGFYSYFAYSYGDLAPRAASALRRLLRPEWADLLDDAMRRFGDVFPTDQSVREAMIDGLPDFGDLDKRWYALEAQDVPGEDIDSVLASTLLLSDRVHLRARRLLNHFRK